MKKGKRSKAISSPTVTEVSRNRTLAYFFLFLCSAFIVYGNSLSNQFVFDDLPIVAENPIIKSFKNIPQAIGLENGQPLYRPVRYVSYMIDYGLYGLNPAGYHISNCIYHGMTAFMVFLVLRVLIGSSGVACVGGLLFVCHPIATDSVAYVSGRRDILVALFYLLSFYYFVQYRAVPRKWQPAVIVGCFMLALGSKEMAATLPAVLLLYDVTVAVGRMNTGTMSTLQKIGTAALEVLKRHWRLYAPIGILCVAFSFNKIFLNYPSIKQGFWGGSPVSNFATVARILCHYIKLVMFPVVLHADYSYNSFPLSTSFAEPQVVAAVVFLAVCVWLIARSLKKQVWVFFGGMWFFITLLPVCHIFPHHELMAEHYLYLPLVGIIILLSPLWQYLLNKKTRAVYVILGCMMLLFSVRTVTRNRDWKDGMTLWASVLKNAPQCARALDNMGLECFKKKEYQTALTYHKKALDLKPASAFYYNNLGMAYGALGDLDKAQKAFQKAVSRNPEIAKAWNNLGKVLYLKGDYKMAGNFFWRSVQIEPDIISEMGVMGAAAYFCLGKRFLDRGLTKDAISAFQGAVYIKPDYVDAYQELAYCYRRNNDNEKALQTVQKLLSIKPDHADAYYDEGLIYYDQNRVAEAVTAFEKGLAIKQKSQKIYSKLADVYIITGDYKNAINTYERAFAAGIQDAQLFYRAALVYKEKENNKQKALLYLKKALPLTADAVLVRQIQEEILLIQGR